jgi:hypothetical protein
MLSPNYAFERTVIRPRNHRRDHATAQRERYAPVGGVVAGTLSQG